MAAPLEGIGDIKALIRPGRGRRGRAAGWLASREPRRAHQRSPSRGRHQRRWCAGGRGAVKTRVPGQSPTPRLGGLRLGGGGSGQGGRRRGRPRRARRVEAGPRMDANVFPNPGRGAAYRSHSRDISFDKPFCWRRCAPPLRGLFHSWICYRWLAPPANLRGASGANPM